MTEQLEINGEQYPIKMGYYVMKQIKKETGMDFEEAMKKAEEDRDLEIHETILFAALQMGHYEENGEMDIPFTKEEMPMVLDMCFGEYLKKFTSGTFFPQDLQEIAEQNDPQSLKMQDDEGSKQKRTK